MSSVSSVSSGVSSLFQALSNTGSSSISSVLSDTSLQSKLQAAPSGDIAKISEAALQLQQASGLFGTSTSSVSSSAATPESLLLQAVNGSITGKPSSASATTPVFTGEPSGSGSTISVTG